MPAIITTSTVSPPLTVASIMAGIEGAMLAAGFSAPIDAIAGATESRIYAYQFNQATKGTAYLKIDVNATLQVRQSLSDNWDGAADAATGAVVHGYQQLTGTNTLTLHAVNHPELRVVLLMNGATHSFNLGYLRPARKEAWWDENAHLFCLMPGANPVFSSLLLGILTSPNPFGFSGGNAFSVPVGLMDRPPLPGNYQLLPAPSIIGLSSPGRCVMGTYSSEVALVAAGDRTVLDSYRVGGQTYQLICRHSSPNTGLAVRV